MSIRSTKFTIHTGLITLAAVAALATACTVPPPDVTPTAAPLPTAVLATITPAPTTEPVKAPADLAVAFVADGTLWLWRTAEDPIPLTKADAFPAPTLSVDAAWLAFTRGGGAFVIGADGANEQPITLDGVPGQLAWHPAQSTLYVTSSAEAATVLQRFDPTTGALSELARFGADATLAIAPDGAHLAIVTPESLQLTDADGVAVGAELTFPAVAVSDTQRWRPTATWIDDSTARLFTITSADGDAATVVWEIGLEAAAAEIARQPGAAFGGLLAPDGKRMLFTRADQTLGLWDLETGAATQVLDAPGAAALAWTPDSQAYVYTGVDPLQPFVIGVAPESVARPAGIGPVLSLRWLSGDWLLYTSAAGAGEQLRLAEVGQSDGLIGVSAAGAIGYDGLSATGP